MKKKEMKKDFKALAEYHSTGFSQYRMKEIVRFDRHGNEKLYGKDIIESEKNHFIETDDFGNRRLKVIQGEEDGILYDGHFELEKGDKVRAFGSVSYVVKIKELQEKKEPEIKRYEEFVSDFLKEKGITEDGEVLMVLTTDHLEQEVDVQELLKVKREGTYTEVGFRGKMKVTGKRFVELVGYRVGENYYIDEDMRVMHESMKEEESDGKFKGHWYPFFMQSIIQSVKGES